jgi:hypothetical protein
VIWSIRKLKESFSFLVNPKKYKLLLLLPQIFQIAGVEVLIFRPNLEICEESRWKEEAFGGKPVLVAGRKK